tara:strand:- start:375 stop:2078 length:1704 start_codon:yes stop_codon:yes gene_type:complete
VIQSEIESRLRQAVAQHVDDAEQEKILVRPCSDPKHGDFQSNALMALAKKRGMNPRLLAEKVVDDLRLGDICQSVDIAGPGFLNFEIKSKVIEEALAAALKEKVPFVSPASEPQAIIIDFSSPNVAKPMHVGHIRSTILGDSLARILRMLGHKVITDNHIGDWGTQFGMLILGWKTKLNKAALDSDPISELERIYKEINSDDSLREAARYELVKLQQGDEENLKIWRGMIELSQQQFDRVYGRLDVQFNETLGESFYNPYLEEIVEELCAKNIAGVSEGAIVVRFPDDDQLNDKPAIVRKSDGASNYTTTDLATLRYRVEKWSPNKIIYVTDGRQQLHFQQLFKIFRFWNNQFAGQLQHVWFGSILGPDGKPFKTRSGETVRLDELLDEAEQRAFKAVSEKNPELEESEKRAISKIIGIGALKYSDLSSNRQSDYVFDWDKMLSLQGNTAPYLQYAYTRVRSIFRKTTEPNWDKVVINLDAAEELSLAKHLMSFGHTLEMVAEDNRPNYLCNYLYDLAGHFSRFYESCPVIKAGQAERESRLVLCELTGRVLQRGLDALGIQVTEVM